MMGRGRENIREEVWRPNSAKQLEVLRRGETEILAGGARGGGKTELGLAWLAEPEYVNNPKYTSLVIRKDYDDLSNWLFRARSFYRGLCDIVGNPAVIRWRSGGMTRVGHWKDRSTIGKYLGHEYAKILVEEITDTIGSKEEFDMLMGSLRSPVSELTAQFLATTNPGGRGHAWVKRHWVDVAYEKTYADEVSGHTRIFIPFKATDNPHCDRAYLKWLDGLHEPLRSAWRDGSWETFQGQFFSEYGKEEQPWDIGVNKATGRVFGSLDIGIGHYTSFGYWYLSPSGTIHRLFTYKANGQTHRAHAETIRGRIESFRPTGGAYPVTVWAGHDAWTKSRLGEDYVRSPVDEYNDVFVGTGVGFVKANTDRQGGCAVMRELFDSASGSSCVYYWPQYNRTYAEDMQSMIIDPNKPEEYQKVDGDDTADECRYGLQGIYTWKSQEIQHGINRADSGKSSLYDRNAWISESGYETIMRETSLA